VLQQLLENNLITLRIYLGLGDTMCMEILYAYVVGQRKGKGKINKGS